MGNNTDVYTTVNRRHTPQTEQADQRQVPNSAGGWTFTVDRMERIRRFLILGTDAGTYYSTAKDLTVESAKIIIDTCEAGYGMEVVKVIKEISTSGRAPRQQPAIFALAIAASHGTQMDRGYALAALQDVCRTGTHLFLFAKYVQQFRGWGPALRRAVGAWYTGQDVDRVAYQAVKYRSREGFTHRDLLRLSHPKVSETDVSRRALLDWITHNVEGPARPKVVGDFSDAQACETPAQLEFLIWATTSLSWEMLPSGLLNHAGVWEALIDTNQLPLGALIRQLPRLTRLEVTRSRRAKIIEQLTDSDRLRRARIHPFNLLVALRTYQAGAGKGSEWIPDGKIVDALDAAFYASFGTVEPAGKRTLIALDVSGSMGWNVAGSTPITCREASAAMALVTMATEPDCDVVAFTSSPHGAMSRYSAAAITPLSISPRQRLGDVIRDISDLPFGGTDCALPTLWAKEQGRTYDTVLIMTDNETWAGPVHSHQALRDYRAAVGVDTKLIVAGFAATDFTIADPADPRQLDVVGLDASVPTLIADFSRGVI